MKKKLLSTLSIALNTYLQLDPESEHRLKNLSGKIISLELLPFHLNFQCEFTDKGVNIHANELLIADTMICGTPLGLISVMLSDDRQQFFADDIKIEGNAEIAQQVINLFDQLHIDWEDYLADLIGDTPAHHAGRLVRNMRQWLQNSEEKFTADLNEYIHEEAKWLPAREALADFYNDVDEIRMSTDRLAAKIKLLEDLM